MREPGRAGEAWVGSVLAELRRGAGGGVERWISVFGEKMERGGGEGAVGGVGWCGEGR